MILDVNTLELVLFILVIPISLLFEGMRRKLTARIQNRVGPPVWQPFYDVVKLLKKGRTESKAEENIFFVVMPLLYFLSTYCLFFFVPLPIISFSYDFILFVYLVILNSSIYVLAGFASNSPFGVFGSMRELLLMVCYEIIFVINITTFMFYGNATSLSEITQTFLILRLPIASVCLLIVAFVETRITPFDTIEADAEIMGGVYAEYSGVGLSYLETAKYMKLTFFIFLTTMLLFGTQNMPLFFVLSLLMLFFFTLLKATTCRYRADQTFNLLVVILLFAVIEFVRIRYLVW